MIVLAIRVTFMLLIFVSFTLTWQIQSIVNASERGVRRRCTFLLSLVFFFEIIIIINFYFLAGEVPQSKCVFINTNNNNNTPMNIKEEKKKKKCSEIPKIGCNELVIQRSVMLPIA